MSHVMISTEDALSFSIHGKQYDCDENGAVLVEDADIAAAEAHGFRKATGAEANLLKSGIVITPRMVAAMDRTELKEFLEARGKEVPGRTAEMRQAVLDAVDEDADNAAAAKEGASSTDPEAKAEGDGEEGDGKDAKEPPQRTPKSK